MKFFISILLILMAGQSYGGDYDFDTMFNDPDKTTSNRMKSNIETEKFDKKTKSGINDLTVEYYYKYEYVPPEQAAKASRQAPCLSIRSEPLRYQCIAQVNSEDSLCYSIKNEGLRYQCIAQAQGKSSLCYSIRNKNMQYQCLAQTQRNEGLCYSIRNKDMQWQCLAELKGKQSMCYSIKNEDLRWQCIATVPK